MWLEVDVHAGSHPTQMPELQKPEVEFWADDLSSKSRPGENRLGYGLCKDEDQMSGSLTDTPFATIAPDRATFLRSLYEAAKASGHIWPSFAACEAAIDSDWGTSELAKQANNVFNLRAPARFASNMQWAIYVQTVNGKQYDWLKFRSLQECFEARMSKLRNFNMYYLALRAKTGGEYIREVSKLWSTDSERPRKVMELVQALDGAK